MGSKRASEAKKGRARVRMELGRLSYRLLSRRRASQPSNQPVRVGGGGRGGVRTEGRDDRRLVRAELALAAGPTVAGTYKAWCGR